MAGKRPRVISSTAKAASGGVIVVIALLGLMFLQGPGTGSGESEGEGFSPLASTDSPDVPLTETDDGTTDIMEPPVSDVNDDILSADERRALAGNVLGVLIDEWDYLMEVPGETQTIYKPSTLDRLILLAKNAVGDSNGIRVRILQRESARPKAEQQLRQALLEIGVTDAGIYMPAEFIP